MTIVIIILLGIVALAGIDCELQIRKMQRQNKLTWEYIQRLERSLPKEPPRAITGRWRKPTGLSSIRYSRAGDLTRPPDVEEPTETRQFPLE
jgi:hypothetical protein